jgi:hypothetical protein
MLRIIIILINLDVGDELQRLHHGVVDVGAAEGVQLQDVSERLVPELLGALVGERMRSFQQFLRVWNPVSNCVAKNLGPYSKHFIFFVTYESAQ